MTTLTHTVPQTAEDFFEEMGGGPAEQMQRVHNMFERLLELLGSSQSGETIHERLDVIEERINNLYFSGDNDE